MKPLTFAGILAPMTPEEFFAKYYDKEPVHIEGAADKFAEVMSWRHLNELLNTTSIWSSNTLKLVLDRNPIPAGQYCAQGEDRGHRPSLVPDRDNIMALLRRGASLVLNDIDSLNPGLAAVSNALEETMMCKAQANLYCSWRERQAFPAHFDTHDVWALHVEGEKTWNVYEGRFDNPIPHPAFRTLGEAYHDGAKGGVLFEAKLTPGDVLYLPRGQYHDALATGDNAIHVAFGINQPLGLDFLNLMYERAVHDSAFRVSLPLINQADGEDTLRERIRALAERFGAMAEEPKVLENLIAFIRNYRFPRGGYDLPRLGETSGPAYTVHAGGLKVVRRGQDFAIKAPDTVIPIPPGGEKLVSWVFERARFTEAEIDAAFAEMPAPQRAQVLAGLVEMQLLRAA